MGNVRRKMVAKRQKDHGIAAIWAHRASAFGYCALEDSACYISPVSAPATIHHGIHSSWSALDHQNKTNHYSRPAFFAVSS